MHIRFILPCPNLKGTSEGAQCLVTQGLIKTMEEVTITTCMSRHYESCVHYVSGLRALAFTALPADAVLEA
ncbi:MAG: hypothetical protein AB1805_03925 [Nitrospirota bacterium]